ncbi:hypothetical protein [Planomonospora alba]|uniref:hypothetical protein n=1 Tax=Planomonospora alba TaxID=161354 RepID=UPI0031E5310E
MRVLLVPAVSACLSLVFIAAVLRWSGSMVPHARWSPDDFALHARVDDHGVISSPLDVLRWAVAGMGALGALAGYGYAELGPAVLLAWFAAVVALIAVLYRSAGLPCLSFQAEGA